MSHILTDSRSLLTPEETLFFAIRTESGDGHRYIESLYERGVRSFVVEQLSSETEAKYSGCNWYVVTSSITALQALARTHRERFPLAPYDRYHGEQREDRRQGTALSAPLALLP